MLANFYRIFEPGVFTAVLAIVSGIVAFYVTSVVEEIRSGPSASYAIKLDRKNAGRLFVLENLSRVHAIRDAHFQLRCVDQRRDCFKKFRSNGEDVYAAPVVNAPNFGRLDLGAVQRVARVVSFCVSAIASSKSTVRFATEMRNSEIMVLYDPWSDKCGGAAEDKPLLFKPLLLLSHWNPHAVLARSYFQLFTLILAVSVLYFLIVAWMAVRRVVSGDTELENKDETEEAVFVFGLRRPSRRDDGGDGG